jgi:hypothetical protein
MKEACRCAIIRADAGPVLIRNCEAVARWIEIESADLGGKCQDVPGRAGHHHLAF